MRQLTLIVCFFLWVGSHLYAQDQIGMKLSNMAPTQMSRLNPSAIVDQKPYRDFEVFGVGAYLMNDFMFYRAEEISILRAQIPEETDYNLNSNPRNLFAQANVFLPSFSTSHNQWAFGLRTNIRTFSVGKDLPAHLFQLIKEGVGFEDIQGQDFSSSGFRASAASWLEIGGQIGTILIRDKKNLLTAGVSVQRLIGIAGSGLYANSFSYNIQNDTALSVLETTSEFGLSKIEINSGKGWGLDFGLTYQRKLDNTKRYNTHSLKSGCNYIDYKWKLGVAIIDVGSLNFTPSGFYRKFDAVGLQLQDIEGFDPQGSEDVTAYLDNGVVAGRVQESNEFKMRLPTSLNVQFDYNLENDFRVGAIANLGFPANNAFGVERPNYVAVIPRYERLRFEAAVPVSINTVFQRPRVGLMLRWAGVTVGTDNVIPYIFDTDVYGADFYFTIRILTFNSKECLRKGVDWRVNDCTAPSIRWGSRNQKQNNKTRYDRNKKRQKRYL